MKKLILLLSLSIILLSSCSKEFFGSGVIVLEDREVESFHSVESTCSIDVIILEGDIQTLSIEADDNLIDKITTRVHNNTLEIDVEPGTYRTTSMTAFITIPRLREIKSSGSGDFEFSGFRALNELKIENNGSGDVEMIDYIDVDHLIIENDGSGDVEIKGDFENVDINNNGSGDIDARGSVFELDIRNSGSGKINAFKLEANTCNLRNFGSGNAYIRCTETLNVQNTGSANVYYKGSANVTIQNTGSGSVRKYN